MNRTRMIGRWLSCSLCLCLPFAAMGSSNRMTTIALYDAQAGATAPDPTTAAGGSWTIPLVNGAVLTGHTSEGGLNGWIIEDEGAGERLWYRTVVSAAEHTQLADGWAMDFEFRLTVGSTTPTKSLGFWYGNDQFERWLVLISLDEDDAMIVTVQHGNDGGTITPLTATLTGSGQGTTDYHTLSIINTTGINEARLRFDGNLVTFDTGETGYRPFVLAGNSDIVGALFGALNWDGGGSMIVRRVELHTLNQCPADVQNNDSSINVFDLLELLANWGTDGLGAAIAPQDDVVDVFDLLDLLAAWGDC